MRSISAKLCCPTGTRAALGEADCDVIVEMDADSQHARLMECMLRSGADVLIGSRALGTYNYKRCLILGAVMGRTLEQLLAALDGLAAEEKRREKQP